MRFLALAVLSGALVPAPAAAEPPQWFLEEITSLTADGGRWVADNSGYRNENEPFEAYVVEWTSGFDGATMTGRLFGLKDGAETPAFWEFRQYWHPGRNEAVLEQFGWGGAIGAGVMTRERDTTITDQVFYQGDGAARREAHRGEFRDSKTHVTESFDIVDGEWKPRRTYVWKLQPAEKE
jgi:hypothetical protein